MFTNTSLSDSNVLLYKAERLLVESSKQFHFCPENPLSIFLLRILSAISGIYIFFGFHVYKYIITRFLLLPNTRQNVSSLNPPNILRFFVVVIHLHYNQIRIFCFCEAERLLVESSGRSHIFLVVSVFTNILVSDSQIRLYEPKHWLVESSRQFHSFDADGYSIVRDVRGETFSAVYSWTHTHCVLIRFAFFVFARRNVCLLNPLGDRIFFASFPCSQIY